MRKLLITALLASVAATPALAAPRDRDAARAERQQDREDRQQAREERREARPERVAPAEAKAPAVRQNVETIRADRQVDRAQRIENRNERIESNRAERELRQAERNRPDVLRNRVPVVSETPRAGTQPPLRTERRRSTPVNWSNHWRNDRRYDWYNWRNRHRSLFRLGFYYDPFGWGYQRYNIGWRMWPSYYHSSFWLNDPWEYRLPYAPPGYRWIRYYDDAILVDTWDGRVVDVIHNFFW